MDQYEREFLVKLSKKIDSLIDKELNKVTLDRSYFEFKLTVDILRQDWTKEEEIVILDDHEGFCNFCNTRTSFYDHERNLHLCPVCYAKLERESK